MMIPFMSLLTPVDPEVMVKRQQWFWRRVTLQATLLTLLSLLALTLFSSGFRTGDWPTATVQLAILASITFLVTMYFAAVDTHDKLVYVAKGAAEVVKEIKAS